MTSEQLPAFPVAKAPGRVSRALIRLMMKHARIVASETLGERYRLVTLEGADLEGAEWVAGEFVQVAMGSAFRARAYTPIDWDADAGRMRLLGFVHGGGPGSAWIDSMRPGDECDFFGPRRSLDVRHLSGPLAFFGDETAIGLAYALIYQNPSRRVICHFEVDDTAAARAAVQRLGIAAVCTVHARQPGEGHLGDIEDGLVNGGGEGAHFVLSGKAGTVQQLRQALRQRGIPSARLLAKAYWAPGKAGLD